MTMTPPIDFSTPPIDFSTPPIDFSRVFTKGVDYSKVIIQASSQNLIFVYPRKDTTFDDFTDEIYSALLPSTSCELHLTNKIFGKGYKLRIE